MNKKGFTLTELMAVIVIIAIIILIAVPSIMAINKNMNKRVYEKKKETKSSIYFQAFINILLWAKNSFVLLKQKTKKSVKQRLPVACEALFRKSLPAPDLAYGKLES